jgi:hypothetical protein
MSAADVDALADAAAIIARRAKVISSAFSSRIPASTHVTVSNGVVAVVTDGATAPNAAPFEGAELHPLWAHIGSYRYEHWHWGKQPYRPYMLTAAVQSLDDAAQAYGGSAYAYARLFGFE